MGVWTKISFSLVIVLSHLHNVVTPDSCSFSGLRSIRKDNRPYDGRREQLRIDIHLVRNLLPGELHENALEQADPPSVDCGYVFGQRSIMGLYKNLCNGGHKNLIGL